MQEGGRRNGAVREDKGTVGLGAKHCNVAAALRIDADGPVQASAWLERQLASQPDRKNSPSYRTQYALTRRLLTDRSGGDHPGVNDHGNSGPFLPRRLERLDRLFDLHAPTH